MKERHEYPTKLNAVFLVFQVILTFKFEVHVLHILKHAYDKILFRIPKIPEIALESSGT